MAQAIESIMQCTMENLQQMIDVNTVIGDAVMAADGSVIIPVSKVSFGFAAGGGEYSCAKEPVGKGAAVSGGSQSETMPFAGGAGAGVTVSPVGFLVVGGGQTRWLNAQVQNTWDRLIDLVPQIAADIKQICTDTVPTNVSPQHATESSI